MAEFDTAMIKLQDTQILIWTGTFPQKDSPIVVEFCMQIWEYPDTHNDGNNIDVLTVKQCK